MGGEGGGRRVSRLLFSEISNIVYTKYYSMLLYW